MDLLPVIKVKNRLFFYVSKYFNIGWSYLSLCKLSHQIMISM